MRKRLRKKKLRLSYNPIDILHDIACRVAKKHKLIVDDQSFMGAKNHYSAIGDLKD